MSQAARATTPQTNHAVTANLRYIVRQDTKPYFESAMITGGEPKVFFETEDLPARINDMRDIADDLAMDVNGFELHDHQSAVADLHDDGLIPQNPKTPITSPRK